MTMRRAPVNSQNLKFLKEFNSCLEEVINMKSIGLILTSSLSTVFSGGIDIVELLKYDQITAEEFWTTLQDVWLKLYTSNFATAAAINGHATAGGCILAILCDYRVMVNGNFTIGLNELAIGVGVKSWLIYVLREIISARDAEYAILTARRFTVNEAKKVRLIDDIATDKVEAIDKCMSFINKFYKTSVSTDGIMKEKLREGPIKKLQENRRTDYEEFLSYLNNPQILQNLEMYVQVLKRKELN